MENTKAARRRVYGPSPWVDVNEAAAIRNESRWKIYKGIRDGKFETWVDETGRRKLTRASAEKP